MSIEHYRGLSETLQHLLPCYWLAGVYEKTHTKNPNQVRLYLEEKDDARERLTSKKPQSYLYNKRDGVPFRNFEKAILINQLVPHSIDILNHPLWYLIDMSKPTSDKLVEVVPLFSLRLQLHISNNDFIEDSDLFLLNELDRLGWIFYQVRKAQITGENLNLIKSKYCILKTLLYFFAVVYQDNINNFKLYKEITYSLPNRSSPKVIRRVTLSNFPQQLEQIAYQSDFDQACHIYREVFQGLIDNDTILFNGLRHPKETVILMKKYNYFLDLSELKAIHHGLKRTQTITPEERDTSLGQLRLKTHLDGYPILPRKIYQMFYNRKELSRNGLWLSCKENNLSISDLIP
jgi:hypothetical protein